VFRRGKLIIIIFGQYHILVAPCVSSGDPALGVRVKVTRHRPHAQHTNHHTSEHTNETHDRTEEEHA